MQNSKTPKVQNLMAANLFFFFLLYLHISLTLFQLKCLPQSDNFYNANVFGYIAILHWSSLRVLLGVGLKTSVSQFINNMSIIWKHFHGSEHQMVVLGYVMNECVHYECTQFFWSHFAELGFNLKKGSTCTLGPFVFVFILTGIGSSCPSLLRNQSEYFIECYK